MAGLNEGQLVRRLSLLGSAATQEEEGGGEPTYTSLLHFLRMTVLLPIKTYPTSPPNALTERNQPLIHSRMQF
jgi:hypothetical protein